MAKNKVYDEGRKLYLPVEAGTVSGSPCVVGSRCGVALTNRDAAGNAVVDFKGVYDLTVTGITAPGTPVYYTANADPDQRLGVVATALFFGYALKTKGASAGVIRVYVSEASGISQVPAGSVAGTLVANVADKNVVGGIPVLHRINIAGGAAGNTDVVLTHKTRIVDVWAIHTSGAGEAGDTIQLFNGATAISDAMSWAGADKALVRAGSIDDASHEVSAGGTLRVTTTDSDAKDNVGAGIVYVLGIRVA